MPIETGDKVEDLNPNWPLGSDAKAEGDDHIRLIKTVLQTDVVSGTGTGPYSVQGQTTFKQPVRTDRAGVPAQYLEIDGGDGAGGYIRLEGTNKPFVLENNTGNGTLFAFREDGVNAALVYPSGTDAPSTAAVITREKGDARFVKLDGSTPGQDINGQLRLGGANDLLRLTDDQPYISWWQNGVRAGYMQSNANGYGIIGTDGLTDWRITNQELANSASIVTRQLGDVRYSQTGERASENLPSAATFILDGIPSYANHVEIVLSLVSQTETGSLSMRLGGSSLAATGYSSSVHRLVIGDISSGSTNNTVALIAWGLLSANSYTGVIKLTRYSGNVWAWTAQGADGPGNQYVGAGRVSLGADVLTRIQLRTGGGTFNAGGAALRYWA